MTGEIEAQKIGALEPMTELVEPWILGVTFSLDPGEVKSDRLQSEYLDLGPVRIFPRFLS